MWPFARKHGKTREASPKELQEKEEDMAELRDALAKAREEIAFLRSQNARLSQEAAPALKENAVLHYELFKCQSDRQVLEFHLSGLRAELGGALALLSRWAPGEPPKGESILRAFLDLLEVGRSLGLRVEGLAEAEAQARAALEGYRFQPDRFWMARLAGILAALEGLLSKEVRGAERPGEALASFSKPLEEVRRGLAQVLASLGDGA